MTKMHNTSNSNYQKQIVVSASSEKTFSALTEDIDIWWSRTSESSQKVNGHFTIHFENGYWWTFKIVEFIPKSKLTWECINGEPEFNKEWIGHTLHWQITNNGSQTILDFHQIGLTPEINCYDICSTTWDMFIAEKLKLHLS